MRVLIIEDNDMLNKAYCLIIEKQGYEIDTAYDGISGLEKIYSFKPDLILLDMLLPKLNGIGVLKKLKDSPPDHEMKILLLTNFGYKKEVEQALELGADAYFLKSSLSPTDLTSIIKKFDN